MISFLHFDNIDVDNISDIIGCVIIDGNTCTQAYTAFTQMTGFLRRPQASFHTEMVFKHYFDAILEDNKHIYSDNSGGNDDDDVNGNDDDDEKSLILMMTTMTLFHTRLPHTSSQT